MPPAEVMDLMGPTLLGQGVKFRLPPLPYTLVPKSHRGVLWLHQNPATQPKASRPPCRVRFGKHHHLGGPVPAAGGSHTTPLVHGPGASRSCLSLISREGPGLLAWPWRGCISFQRANEPQLLIGEKGHEQACEEWDPPQGARRGDCGCPLPRAGSPGCPLTAILKAWGCSHQNTRRGLREVALPAALP